MKFGRYVTVDDGGNYVTFHELNRRLRKDKKITKAQSDSVSNREFLSAVTTAPRFLVFFFSFVGDQTKSFARPSLGRDFESRNL